MPAIKMHRTAVDKTADWDGPKAVAAAPAEATVLRYMHAWVDARGDESKKASYKFPHHEPGTDTPAVIAGVNNALARLAQANIPNGDRPGVEAHLRRHRKDAGLEESMSEAEIAEAVKAAKVANDLKAAEAEAFLEAVRLQEKQNLAEWLESRLHLALTQIADDLFGGGNVSRNERIALSGAIGVALDAYHQFVQDNSPQLFGRRPWEEAPAEDNQPVKEAATIKAKARAAARALRDLLADKTLPKELHDGVEGLVSALQKTWKDLAADAGNQEEAAGTEIVGDYVELVERAVRQDGSIPIKIIQPGWGSSGYYPVEVLKRDGPKLFTKGTKMYWNHQTAREEAERPEGDLNDLAAVLTGDARWQENGPRGPGLYADAKVFEHYRSAVDSLAPHIGVSIRAFGKAAQGTTEGRSGQIINELIACKSVDFVTEPGAGGEIITMFEAARTVRAEQTVAGTIPAAGATDDVAISETFKEEEMDELKQLQEKVATLQTGNETLAAQNARLSEALALRDAKDMAREALTAVPSLPEVTRARLMESLAKNPPIKDGALDREAFAKTIETAIKAEVKYLESVADLGQIRGLGESAQGGDEQDGGKILDNLEAAFAAIGLNEKSAKVAAKGRE